MTLSEFFQRLHVLAQERIPATTYSDGAPSSPWRSFTVALSWVEEAHSLVIAGRKISMSSVLSSWETVSRIGTQYRVFEEFAGNEALRNELKTFLATPSL